MMTRDTQGAEEVTQDAFVRAFQHLDKYEIGRPLYPWLATIATRLALSWLRRDRREVGLPPEGVAPDGSQSADALDRLVADERNRNLWREVSALPQGERTAMLMFYRDDMKVSEIASALGVTTGTIKTLLFRGRRHLRRALESRIIHEALPEDEQ